MKSKLLLHVILFAGLMLANYSAYPVYGQIQQNKQVKQNTVYTCSSHPEIVQDHPGNCPKCGMKCVEKKDKSNGDLHQSHDSSKMKNDHMKMMHDSCMMENYQMKMMHDSCMMKKDHMKMMHDSSMMEKDHMMHDSTAKKHDHMKM